MKKPAASEQAVIIHAGNVGAPEIIDQLSALAPLVVARGSIDKGIWAALRGNCGVP